MKCSDEIGREEILGLIFMVSSFCLSWFVLRNTA
jgi:hypothetical protein